MFHFTTMQSALCMQSLSSRLRANEKLYGSRCVFVVNLDVVPRCASQSCTRTWDGDIPVFPVDFVCASRRMSAVCAGLF